MLRATFSRMMLGTALGFCFATAAMADFDMPAGPIWNNDDAKNKCPSACYVTPTGQWHTTIQGRMSVCAGMNDFGYVNNEIPVGPIWNNDEAPAKCAAGLERIHWNGNWTTTKWNEMSVCGCTGEADSGTEKSGSKTKSKSKVGTYGE